jgi:hypothetical protein
VPDESAGESILSTPSESNALFMSRRLWAELGGYGEEFIEPGGGYANLDMWTRATTFPGALPILLLGESTFHQLHGGVATNAVVPRQVEMHAEYERIRGTSHEVPTLDLHYWGSVANRAFRERGSGERVDLDDPALWSAFRERDRAIAELEAVVDSTIWRSTAWYRRLRNGRAPGTSPS